jgi:hypothetical protein
MFWHAIGVGCDSGCAEASPVRKLSPAFGPFQNGSFGRQLLESGRLFDNAVMALKPTIHHSGRGDNRRLRTRGEVINQHL